MANRTWIDVASDLIAGPFVLTEESMPFSTDQIAMLQKILQESFLLFAKEVAGKVGDKLAQFQAEMQCVKSTIADIDSATLRLQVAATISDQNPSVDATSSQVEATRLQMLRTKKNTARKLSRQKSKQKYMYAKSQLLTLMPRHDLA